MNTSPIALEIKSDLSALDVGLAKLRAIADAMPVTVANFIAGAGGMVALVDMTFDGLLTGAPTFDARPNEKLRRFLEIFSEDDLVSEPQIETKIDLCGCTEKEGADRIAAWYREQSRQGGAVWATSEAARSPER